MFRRRPGISRGSIAASSRSSVAPAEFFLERARVALSAGSEFGEPGHGFVRLNFATSQDILDRILDRMIKACPP